MSLFSVNVCITFSKMNADVTPYLPDMYGTSSSFQRKMSLNLSVDFSVLFLPPSGQIS